MLTFFKSAKPAPHGQGLPPVGTVVEPTWTMVVVALKYLDGCIPLNKSCGNNFLGGPVQEGNPSTLFSKQNL